ncbi:T9SS type A sorting domain-containing protein [Paucihalobacter sp.]|uniref:T9SS type A sorting domain-containing protein n=1 Tax=Paucihalobacter sp. TaxID=2850405 RepID=UPI002FE165D3
MRVFKNINNNWIQIGNDIDGEAINDFSGWSVTLSENGNFVAVGAIGNDENGEDSGHVKVYENLDETWTQIGNNINGEDAGDSSGGQVFLSGDGTILAIGAAGNDGNGQDSGHVRVFQYNFGSWNQIGNDIDGEAANDFSGESISLSKDGGKIAIGASSNTGNGSFSGHVRVFGLSNILSSDSFVQTNFNLYPNPATNFIILDLQENIRLEKINIYSTLGQLIKTETDTFISVNNLSKGTYFVEVISNRGKTTKVLLIK